MSETPTERIRDELTKKAFDEMLIRLEKAKGTPLKISELFEIANTLDSIGISLRETRQYFLKGEKVKVIKIISESIEILKDLERVLK